MNSLEQIFLTRDGKVLGPITPSALSELRKTGEIVKYFWLWDGSTPDWIPANLPPPLPRKLERPAEPPAEHVSPALGSGPSDPALSQTSADELDGIEVEDPSYPKPVAPKDPGHPATEATPQYFGKSILALCHDYRSVMGGKLMQASTQGCTLLVPTQASTLPPFRKGNRVFLNLLEESTGRSENIATEILGCVRRTDGEWEYTLKWGQLPAILG